MFVTIKKVDLVAYSLTELIQANKIDRFHEIGSCLSVLNSLKVSRLSCLFGL